MSGLIEQLKQQSDRISALEESTLDDHLIIPNIAKVLDGIKVSSKLRITKRAYYICGPMQCSATQSIVKTKTEEVI